jgi:salicylate hydroxylase
MRILIAGAGIGGLAAALALLRHGFEVSIHEHAQTLSEVGAGLQIGPNGAKVLQALGLTEALAAVAFHPESAEMRVGTSGRVIFSLPLGEPALRRYGAPYYHLHRADLHAVLKQAVEARAPGCIHLGHEVREVRQDAQGVELGFANGTSDRGALLIGADGVHSVVRRELFDIADGEYTGMSAWRMTVPASRLPKGLVPPKATVWVGPGKHVVTYYLRGGELINLVGVVEEAEWPYDSWTSLGGKSDILADFKGWHPIIQRILESGDDGEYYKWALRALPPLEHWSQGRATLLGDACHPMLPFMAQGAVMAIEDAWVLAEQLARNPQDLPGALSRYEALRKPRATRVQSASRRNGKLYHQHSTAGQAVLYSPLWMVSRVAPDFFAGQLDWLYGEDVTAY